MINRCSCVNLRRPLIMLAAAYFTCVATARAAEVHSNGAGGGPWSDPATWRNKALPGPADSAIVSSGDTVVFDRDDEGKTTCRDLNIDPKGTLSFKPGGKRLLSVVGPIEIYGVIKLDATGAADDFVELRFTGSAAQRIVKLAKGGAILASGRSELPDGKRNVIVRSKRADVKEMETLSFINGVPGTSIDLRHAQLDGVSVRANKIDNTGAKANERMTVDGCLFTTGASIIVGGCDTPSITNNTFAYAGAAIQTSAIEVSGSPLAEVRGNSISGKYAYGIHGYLQQDSVVTANAVSGCAGGIFWCGTNDMLKSIAVRECDVGIVVTSMTGAMEDVTFDNCKTALNIAGATLQAMNLKFVDPPKDAVRISFGSGAVTLVNCDVTPEQIQMVPPPAATPTPRVVAMQFCVVGVKGPTPAGAMLELTTANPPKPLPKGAADLNIRNAPAAIAEGLTPLPKSFKPLLVKSWVIEGDGKLTPPPHYDLSVLAPADKPDGEPKRIKTVSVTPDASWYRAKPDDSRPTMEITLP